MIRFEYAAFSDVGLIRKSNQDAGYASSHLLVLADGMGGAAGGDVASSVVVGNLAQVDDSHQAEDLLPLLKEQLTRSQEQLLHIVEQEPELSGLGTTCIAILRTGNKLGMVHVGDSRAYLLRHHKLTQITRDHTLVQYLVDHGELTPEEALHHPKRHVIMRNIGANEGPADVDTSVREALPGDRWLLTSDGLFDVVSDETIEYTLQTYPDLDTCGERLIELALAGGAPDNVTLVLADVVDDAGTSSSYDRGPIVVGSAAIDHTKPTRAGLSAAGQLVALTNPLPVLPELDIQHDHSPRRWIARLAVFFLALLTITGGLGAGYYWTQTQYYVSLEDNKVAIFKGIPQSIGPFDLSEVYEVTTIHVSQLTPIAQNRLTIPITRSSLSEARKVVHDLSAQTIDASPQAGQQSQEGKQSPAGQPTSPSQLPGDQP
ncbi:serine/threonine-protein phosphatase [Arcanobacterium phocisimile]|uniref:Serine/threonine-protein phosphatase n=1 Tax=Arcanobacterium phocisimile TaxID=1302235 RepID=A0ABX7IHQ1_9ACTO|nr:protein phosphatase 2C domain-containing protein [Arcanobacterium phocisimile]QRV02265.1 serine/threonine-protein phosphatase [Arcanobacterium phocisimile]